MNLKGPQLKKPNLKLSELKAPPFLGDVFFDLRERRLLPLVALVVVAIAAVPFLLGSDAEEPVPPVDPATLAEEEATGGSSLHVVEAQPGLRDYRKRLRGKPTDPFKQRYTSLPPGAQLTTTDATSGGGGGELSVSEDTVVTVDEPVGSPGPTGPRGTSGGSGGGSGRSGKTANPDGLKPGRLYGHRPNVRFGQAGSGNLNLYKELPLGSFLPKNNPVVLFVGVTQNGKRALFSVTPEVSLVRGNGDCVGGVRNCQILSMRPGRAVTLLTGAPNRSFRLHVVEINLVEVGIPKKQPEKADGSSSDKGQQAEWAQGLSVVGQFERRRR